MSELVAPVLALAADPSFTLESLSPVELIALANYFEAWARPDQLIPRYPWRYYGFVCGRGWGKTFSIPEDINRRVREGEISEIGLMAPTDDRVADVQFSGLIASAPPWFRPEVRSGELVWPNGAKARGFTPFGPGRSRSENLHASWLTEIVDWQHTTRREAFDNITTATRVGTAPQVYWDTTSKGRNDVIAHLFDEHARNPRKYPIVRGEIFDNPMLSGVYLESEASKYAGQRFDEELRGWVFSEGAGALFRQTWINRSRRDRPLSASEVDVRIVVVDPALSNDDDADEFGIIIGARMHGDPGRVLVEHDHSGHYSPEEWGDLVVSACVDGGAAGASVERNHSGDSPAYVIRSRARTRDPNLVTRTIEPGKPFPRRTPGVIYIRETVSRASKAHRATGPAAETEAGNVQFFGEFPQLEDQLTTWIPGTGKSPNRLDAFCELVNELRGLARDKRDGDAQRATHAAAAGMRALGTELRIRTSKRRIGL